ncbi:MAG: hypothetical protein WD512_06405 [Candidatus Paceibacterota bacterium]
MENNLHILLSGWTDFNVGDIEIFRIIENIIGSKYLVKTMWLRNIEGAPTDLIMVCFRDFGDSNMILELLNNYQWGGSRLKAIMSSKSIESIIRDRRRIESIQYGMIF